MILDMQVVILTTHTRIPMLTRQERTIITLMTILDMTDLLIQRIRELAQGAMRTGVRKERLLR